MIALAMGEMVTLQGQRLMPPRPFVRCIEGDFGLLVHPAGKPWATTVYGRPIEGLGIPVENPRTECLTRLDVGGPRPAVCACGAVDIWWGPEG